MKLLIENWKNYLSSLDETMKDLKDVKAKYADNPQMSKVIAKFEEIDPSGNYKYIRWMAKQAEMALKNDTFEEDIPYIVDSIKGFHEFSGKASVGKHMQKDINAYKDLAKLVADVEEAKAQAEDAARKKEKDVEDRKQAKEESEVIYDDDNFMVIRPTSEYASCYYGRGTRWCISATEASNYFDQYTNEGKAFYFVIDKTRKNNDPLKKVAWVATGDGFEEYYDSTDNSIGYDLASSQIEETSPDEFSDIVGAMEDHLKDNPVPKKEKTEEDIQEEVREILRNFESRTTSRTSLYTDVEFRDDDVYITGNAETELYLSVPEDARLTEEQEEEVIEEAKRLVYSKIKYPYNITVMESYISHDSPQGETKYTIEIPISHRGAMYVEDLESFAEQIIGMDNKIEDLDREIQIFLTKEYPDTLGKVLEPKSGSALSESLRGDKCIKIKIKQG